MNKHLRRTIRKTLSYLTMLIGLIAIIIGTLDALDYWSTGNTFLLLSALTAFCACAKFIFDYNRKTKYNDILWISLTFACGLVLGWLYL